MQATGAVTEEYGEEHPMIPIGATLAAWSVAAIVAVVPLLINLSNLADTYYGPKARALAFFAPVLIAAVAASLMDERVRQSLPWRPLLAFAAAASAATALSVNPAWSLPGAPWRHEGLLSLLGYTLVCAATVVAFSSRRSGIWLAAVLAGATLVAGYGVAQYFGYEWLVLDVQRLEMGQPFSTTGNPNWLGAYMVLTVPLAIAAVLTANRRTILILGTVSLTVTYLAGLFTYSRAAWAGLALVIVLFTVLVVLQRDFPGRKRYRWTLLLLLALTAIFLIPNGPLASPVGGGFPLHRARSVLTIADASGGTMRSRLYLWQQAIPLLVHRPLLGYGPDTQSLVFLQLWDEEKRQIFGEEPKVVDRAHNDTLDLALSVGLVGVVAFLWLFVVCLRRVWTAATAAGPHQALAVACGTGMIAYWVDLQFHFSVVSVAPVFWSVLGMAAVLRPTTNSAPLR